MFCLLHDANFAEQISGSLCWLFQVWMLLVSQCGSKTIEFVQSVFAEMFKFVFAMKWGPEGKALLLEWDQNRFQATNISADEVEVIKDGAKANKKLAAIKTSKRSFCTVIFNMAAVEKVKKKGGKKRSI